MVRSEKERISAEIRKRLEELGGKNQSDGLFEVGDRFVIPQRYARDLRGAILAMEQYREAQETETDVIREFPYRPWDGTNALSNVIKRIYGVEAIGKAITNFLRADPPKLITINTGVDETTQVPWGRLWLPELESTLHTSSADGPRGTTFVLSATTPRRNKDQVEGLFNLVETELRTNSIYRGKAFYGNEMPEFLDPFTVDASTVIYSAGVELQIAGNIWSLLRETQRTIAKGLSLKRTVLLAGPYGTGKSLTGLLTAQEAVKAGWTFIFVRPGEDDLTTAMHTAQLYQPSVVFYEDVDVVSTPGAPGSMARLLDIFDGINAKNTQIMVVMTTNHPERIHEAMLRPGRVDAVIRIGALEREGVERLFKVLIPSSDLGETSWDEVYRAVDGYHPAFLAEVAQRAVRYSIARGNDDLLTTSDLVAAAEGLRDQHELMEGATDKGAPTTIDELISSALEKIFTDRYGR